MSLLKTEPSSRLPKISLGFLGSWYKLVLVGVTIALACRHAGLPRRPAHISNVRFAMPCS